MKTNLMLLLLWSLIIPALQAQVTGFSLRDYQYTDFKRQNLAITSGTRGGIANSKNSISTLPDSKNANNSFNLNGRITYSKLMNNRNWQQYFYTRFSNRINRANFKANSDPTTAHRDYDLDFSFNSDNRRYFSNNFFLEGNFDGGVDLSWNRIVKDSETEITNEQKEDLRFELGLGKGRLEFIQDAQLALFILRDFEKLGILDKTLSPEDVTDFANLITIIRNARFFDRRHKKIFQIKQMDSLLQSKGIIADGDAASFTSIYDHWDFANNPNRYAGSRISGGIKATGEFGQNTIGNILGPEEYTTVRTVPGAYLEYRLEIPISLFLQHSFFVDVEVGFDEQTDSRSTIMFDDFISYVGDIEYQLGFYPNTRTFLSASASISGLIVDEINTFLSNSLSEELSFEGYYYISPQARLEASFNLGFNQRVINYEDPNNLSRTTHNLLTNLSVGFSYGIL